MNSQEFLASLQSRGLRAWQANFVASFLDTDAAPFQMLTAPPGTGKTYTSAAIAAEIVTRGATRILVLPPASLCDQWQEKLSSAQSKLPVVLVTRRIFREIEASHPIGRSPWDADGIYIISQDLAKQSEFAAGLSAIDWNLVIFDEAHRLAATQRAALLDRMMTANAVRRLLLLTVVPNPTLMPWLNSSRLSSPLAITKWYGELKDWDGSIADRQKVEWRVVPYTRNSDEVKFLSGLLGLMPISGTASDGDRFLNQTLTDRASSSLFAIEQSLQRLKSFLQLALKSGIDINQGERDLVSVGNILTSTSEGTGWAGNKSSKVQSEADSDVEDVDSTPHLALQWEDLTASLAVVKQCLDALDLVSDDEKLNALKAMTRSIVEVSKGSPAKILIFSTYADTVSYLHTATEDFGLPLSKLTGGSSFKESQAVIGRFSSEGGLLFCTDAALKGLDLPQIQHFVHYDLPSNPLVLEWRCGRCNRFGRTAPLTMYLLKDKSGILPFESQLIEKIGSTHDVDADQMDESGSP